MASKLNPYLNFHGTARDAMEFYRDVFGGELFVRTFEDFNQGEGGADLIMHSSLQTPSGYVLFASDVPPGMERIEGENVVLCLSGDDAEELRGHFRRLAHGGTVRMPLEKQMWGDEFGMLVDRFGMHWMVNIGSAG